MKKIVYLLLIFCFFGVAVAARDVSLRVGYVGVPPYLIKYDKGPEGFAVSLWGNVSRQMGHLHYVYVDAGADVDQALKQLSQGDYDVLIGNISITSHRMDRVEFTTPFMLNETVLVIPKGESLGGGFYASMIKIITSKFGLLFAGLFVVMILVSFLYWFTQRRYCSASKSKKELVQSSVWITTLAMVSGEVMADPKNISGRIVIVVACVFGLILFSMLGAAFTTSLLRAHYYSDNSYTVKSLRGNNIIILKGSVQEEYVKDVNAVPVNSDSVLKGLELLKSDPEKYRGFAMDYSLARIYLNKHSMDDLKIASVTLGNDLVAFALPLDSPYRKQINGAIAYASESGVVKGLCLMYIIDSEERCLQLTL